MKYEISYLSYYDTINGDEKKKIGDLGTIRPSIYVFCCEKGCVGPSVSVTYLFPCSLVRSLT